MQDYRTNIHHTLKKNPLQFENLRDFVACYLPENRKKRIESWSHENSEGRWKKFTYEEIVSRDKANLDIFWLKDDDLIDFDNLPQAGNLIDDIIENIESALANFKTIRDALN